MRKVKPIISITETDWIGSGIVFDFFSGLLFDFHFQTKRSEKVSATLWESRPSQHSSYPRAQSRLAATGSAGTDVQPGGGVHRVRDHEGLLVLLWRQRLLSDPKNRYTNSKELIKAAAASLKKALTEVGGNVPGSVHPSFGAGLPLPAPEIL